MSLSEFNLKTRTIFGQESALSLPNYLKEMNLKKLGIIVDSGVLNTDYVKKILENIKNENFEKVYIWEYDLKSEPDYDSLDRIKTRFLDSNLKPTVDCFIGIGGGSVIDFAKGLSTLVVNYGNALNYRGFPKNIIPSLPTIALVTTIGTGSEVTYNAVFIDKEAKKKLGINTMHNFPALAVLDPNLTLSCPNSVISSSGMDALTHTLESYVATKANPLTRIFAENAFNLIFNNLLKVLEVPGDLESRSKLQLGAYLAGISLMNSGSGVAGALSYSLGVHFGVPHGIAGALYLPHVVDFNIQKGYDYSRLCDLIDGVDKSLAKEEKNRIFGNKLFELGRRLNVPDTLRYFGVDESNLNILLKEAENLDKAFAQNPIPFTVEDGKQLLIKLIK